MAKLKDAGVTTGGYRGKRAKTGNSLGFRFDKALFQSHPEFFGKAALQGQMIGIGFVPSSTADTGSSTDFRPSSKS